MCTFYIYVNNSDKDRYRHDKLLDANGTLKNIQKLLLKMLCDLEYERFSPSTESSSDQ